MKKPSQSVAVKKKIKELDGVLEEFTFEKYRPTLEQAQQQYVVHPEDGIRGVLEGASAAFKVADYYSAETLADEVLKHDDKCALAYVIRGKARCNAVIGADDAAIKDLEKGIKLGDNDSRTYAYLARLYFVKKQNKKALAAIDRAIELEPDQRALYKSRAALCVAVGQKTKALSDYGKILELDPENSDTYFMRAQLHETMSNKDAAFNDYAQVVKIEKRDEPVPIKGMAYKRRAVILSGRGDHKKAVNELTEAMAFDDDDDELFRLRGQEYAAQGQYRRAVLDYTRAISMAPEFERGAYESRAVAYEKIGEFGLAKKDREEAKRLADKPAEEHIDK
ncbi:MAG: tetratricopeptide repeat protein [Candidatus Obscuribacterales bacterium]|nr:tetratricopeptide repeat protein [Candidatus Obscuribacterales bacterium]